MGALAWIGFGLIAGTIARLITPGPDSGGFFLTIVIGIVGSLVGGFIGTVLGLGSATGFNLGSFVLAVAGAILLLYVYRVARRT